VLLRYRRREHDTFRTGVADAGEQIAGRFLRDGDVDVDLIGRAGHRWRLDVDVFEIPEPLDAHLRTLDPRTVVPRAFELPELAADHFIARLGIAGDVDLPHVGAPAGIHVERERCDRLVAVELRHGVHVGERIAFGPEPVADVLCRRLQPLAGK